MTSPRSAETVSDRMHDELSSIQQAVAVGRNRWQWVQQTRPWRAFSHFTDVGGSVLTAGMSYQALFAVVAALWVGFGVLGIALSSRPELLNALIEQINISVPGLIGPEGLVKPDELLKSRALTWTQVIASISLLWVMLNWFTGTRRSIRIIFGLDVRKYRNAVLLKLRDFMLAVLFGIALLVSASLTVLSSNITDAIFDWFGWSRGTWLFGTMGTIARDAAMYVFDVLVLMAMHRYLAEVRVPRLKLLIGCALGGAGLLVLKVLGASLLGGASSNQLLASFAVLIGVLLWFNLICRVLLLTAAWIATGVDRSIGLPPTDLED